MVLGPTGRPAEIKLEKRLVVYAENGLRTATAEATLEIVEQLLESRFFSSIVRVLHEGSGLPYYVSRFVDPTDGLTHEPHPGKGLTETQSKISAALEGVERYCSKLHGDELLVAGSYSALAQDAVNPVDYVLPADTTYHEALDQDWVWGYSLTEHRERLVPASLVFCPYDTDPHERRICDYSSNGLAAGNCLEEAILQGLLELVERDAWMIMEYNRIAMPDVVLSESVPAPVRELVGALAAWGISIFPKNLTNDIPIYTFGAFMRGENAGRSAYAFAPGTHVLPAVALARCVTEAVQVYPHYAETSSWLQGGPIDHLHYRGPRKEEFDSYTAPVVDDIAACVGTCLHALERIGSEVVVVDLSRHEARFPVVRVLCTELQPIINRTNPRFSRRLYSVPVSLGYRDRELSPADIEPRDLCGIM